MAAVSGCEAVPERHPKAVQRVVLSADRATPDLTVGVVNALEVTLPPGPPGSGGFAWEISSNNVKVLEQMGPMRPVASGDGRAPATSVSFYALKPGRSLLRFVLIRPNVAEATPAAACQLTVVVSE
jgi:hypothetical protein